MESQENSPTSPSISGSLFECRPTYGSNVPLNGAWNGSARGSNVPLNGPWNGGARGSNVPLNGPWNGGARGSNVPLSGALNGGARGNNVPLNGALNGGACGNNVPLNGALNGGAQGSNVPLNGALDGAHESLFSGEDIWSQERQTLESGFWNWSFTDRNRALPSSSSPARYHDELPRNGNGYLIDLEESEEMFTTNQIFHPQIPNAVMQTSAAERSSYRMQTQNDNVQSLQNHGNGLHQLSNSPRTSTFPLIWTSDPSDTFQRSQDPYWKYAAANSQFWNFYLNYFAVNLNNNNNSNNQLGAEVDNNLHGYHDQGLCREAEGFGIHHGENAAYPHGTATLMSNGLANAVPRISCNSRHDLQQYQEQNSLESLWFPPPSNPGHDQDFNSAESFQLPPVNCGYSLRTRQVYNPVDVVAGKIYYLAKNHEGCSFLRMILKEGTAKDVQKVFNELANHFIELSSHPSGNNIVRNLLELCSTDQRKFIVSQLTRNPAKLFRISCDMHGVQVVRKLIEVIKDSDEIVWVVTALRPYAAILMKDDNGCLVVEHCLERLSPEHCQFLLDVAIACSADLAMDPKGCCTLQNCIKHSTGERKDKLTITVASLALTLSNDTYGNYAVQCVLDYGTPFSKSLILDLLRGHHVNLSKKKYASNVVEKCLLVTERDNKEDIILELVSSPSFSRLLIDQYGNYVVQTALRVSKGPLRAALVNAIKPHAAKLRISPYKKVLSEAGLMNK